MQQKRILFDLLGVQPSRESRFHGGGEYGKTVFRALARELPVNRELEVFYDHERFIDQWILDLIQSENLHCHRVKSLADISDILNSGVDTLYSPLPYKLGGVQIPGTVKVIGTVHGLRNLEMATDSLEGLYVKNIADFTRWLVSGVGRPLFTYRNRRLLRSCLNQLDVVVAVSRHSKYSIKTHIPNVDIDCVHALYTPMKVVSEEISDKRSINEPYILLIMGNRWLKNSYRALKALKSLDRKGLLKDLKIVVCGGMPPLVNYFLGRFRNRIIEFGYVEVAELEALYRDAELFIYPTLNEGFGMPPIEAMKHGTMSIVAATSATTEVLSESVYYFDPRNLQEIENRILMALIEPIDSSLLYKKYMEIFDATEADLLKLRDIILE